VVLWGSLFLKNLFMAKWLWMALPMVVVVVGMPLPSWAQGAPTGLAGDIHGLQATLDTVYDSMMVNVGELVGVGQGLAGIGALLYVCYRVWGHLARAEAIDFYPLLRPFALGLVLALYPGFIGALHGLLQPTVTGTAALVNNANEAITVLLAQKEAALEQTSEWQMYVGPDGSGSLDKWEQYSGEAASGVFSGVANSVKFAIDRLMYNLRNSVKVSFSEILQLIYEAAALCINTLRTFNLILLSILGPIVIGLSCFDGFKSLLSAWIGRYINVFLWLPVANIFGSLIGQIQEEMIKLDTQQLLAGGSESFGATDAAYIIFLLIAIVGYFCVPSITNHIINVFPSGGGALQQKVTNYGPQAMMKQGGTLGL
jgi:conjugative transposon TraJ protein